MPANKMRMSSPQIITDMVVNKVLDEYAAQYQNAKAYVMPHLFDKMRKSMVEEFAKYQRWINLFNVAWEDGVKKGNYQFASRQKQPALQGSDRPDAVIIVATHVKKLANRTVRKLVLIHEFRIPIGEDEWGFPAGLVNGSESIEDAARRELREETGFELTKITHVTPPLFSSAGLTDETASIVFCECEGDMSIDGHEDGEKIDPYLFSVTGIKKLLKQAKKPVNGQKVYVGAKAYPILLMYQQANKL